jgi:hypothetical protein
VKLATSDENPVLESLERSDGSDRNRRLFLSSAIIGGILLLYGVVWLYEGSCSMWRKQAAALVTELSLFKKATIKIGIEPREVQQLESQAQRLGLNLEMCCSLKREGSLSAEEFHECQVTANRMVGLTERVAVARSDPAAAAGVVAEASRELSSWVDELEVVIRAPIPVQVASRPSAADVEAEPLPPVSAAPDERLAGRELASPPKIGQVGRPYLVVPADAPEDEASAPGQAPEESDDGRLPARLPFRVGSPSRPYLVSP